jgi:transcription antitermination factor NusG
MNSRFRSGRRVEVLAGNAKGLFGRIESVDQENDMAVVVFSDLEQQATFTFDELELEGVATTFFTKDFK